MAWTFHRLRINTAKELHHRRLCSAPVREPQAGGRRGSWGCRDGKQRGVTALWMAELHEDVGRERRKGRGGGVEEGRGHLGGSRMRDIRQTPLQGPIAGDGAGQRERGGTATVVSLYVVADSWLKMNAKSKSGPVGDSYQSSEVESIIKRPKLDPINLPYNPDVDRRLSSPDIGLRLTPEVEFYLDVPFQISRLPVNLERLNTLSALVPCPTIVWRVG
ncbi:hypothetical protein B0H14DRAFT_2655748 [Mycena olivaceomarginata]|nr:hypothetical protein B0H14DRAFT_2655748 [Mycena olivaceomarginata]